MRLLIALFCFGTSNAIACSTTDYEAITSFSTAALAVVTAALAWFTYRLWNATGTLVKHTTENSERQLRAYVSMKLDGKLFVSPDGLLNAPFITQNYGATPAHGMFCSLNINLFRFPLDTKLDPPNYAPTSSTTVLFPGEHVRQYAALPSKLNQSEIDVISKGEAAIYVWGEVRYIDAFREPRSTQICMYSTGEDFNRGELAYHHEGNTAN